MVKVGEIYTLLGIKKDQKSFDSARASVERMAGEVSGTVERLSKKASTEMAKVPRAVRTSFAKARVAMTSGLKKYKTEVGKRAQGIANIFKSRLLPLIGISAAVFSAKGAGQLRQKLNDLEIAAKGNLGTVSEMTSRFLGLSSSTGKSAEDLVRASHAFISLTGDAKGAKESIEAFAKASVATSGDIEDMARVGAAMSQSLGIANKDMDKGFSILIASGKEGSVELKNLASVLAPVAAASAQFADSMGLDGLASTAAAMQLVARASGGNADKAKVQLESLFSVFEKKSGELKKAGVDVFNIDPKTGQQSLKSFKTILEDINSSSLGSDITALAKLLGSKEASAAFKQLTATQGEWDKLTSKIRGASDLQSDYAKASDKSLFKVKKALNSMKNAATKFFSVMIDGFGLVVDNLETVAIVIMSGIVVALYSMGAAAIAAKISMVALWLASVAGPLLMIALIAAIVAAILDFVDFLKGNRSGFGDAFGEPVKQWRQDMIMFIDWAKKAFTDLALFVPRKLGKAFDFVADKLGLDIKASGENQFNTRTFKPLTAARSSAIRETIQARVKARKADLAGTGNSLFVGNQSGQGKGPVVNHFNFNGLTAPELEHTVKGIVDDRTANIASDLKVDTP